MTSSASSALDQLLPQTAPGSSVDPALHTRSPTDLAPFQQQALTERLTALLPAIPPLRAMAEAQGLSADCALDDAPKLFFPHAIYKSYDPAWQLGLDFARMSRCFIISPRSPSESMRRLAPSR